jgi:bifunctional UDP-N-acetylglucosamine pyrophosphorylase/glucosamine-1-phosphate N-acetyltransferase
LFIVKNTYGALTLSENLEVVILAAGQGSRMKSALPKVLHPVAGRSMLAHVVSAAQSLGPKAIHVVVGHGADQVRSAMSTTDLHWVVQDEQLGTGHAVLQAMPAVCDDSIVLVMYGDVPLITTRTLSNLVSKAKAAPALLTAVVDEPLGLGRIVRDERGKMLEVVEEKDATNEQLGICEVNTGVLAAPAADLKNYLPRVGNSNKQGEYYLPDILGLAVKDGKTIESCAVASELEVQGVNDRVQLNQVEREFQRRQAEDLMRQGVSIADINRLDIRGSLRCGEDVAIDVNVVMEGSVELGNGARVGPNCVLIDTRVEAGAVIHAFSHLQESVIGSNCSVGPYARLRPGSQMDEGAKVGNFVEIKKSNVGKGSKINHLSYIGDCEMGSGVNVGAGTIVCNYDGVNKSKTVIGDGVFVGSNSTLVAPLTIEQGAFIGAGSAVTRTVEENELAVSRARQKNIQGWQRPTKKTGE